MQSCHIEVAVRWKTRMTRLRKRDEQPVAELLRATREHRSFTTKPDGRLYAISQLRGTREASRRPGLRSSDAQEVQQFTPSADPPYELLLEAMFSMPFEEMRMGAVGHSRWRERMTGFVDDRPNLLRIIRLPRDPYLQIVSQANETTIKHPMRCAGKSDPIADNIRPTRFHGSNMCGRNFRPTSPIDEL